MSWVFAVQGRRGRAPGGRCWSSLATVERPRTAQLRPTRLTAGTLDAPGLNLNRRQSVTMAGAPTDHARVCLAAPPLASATLSMASTRASCDGGTVAITGALSLGSCGQLEPVRELTWVNDQIGASRAWAAFPVIPRCSPPDLVRLWCATATSDRPGSGTTLSLGCRQRHGTRVVPHSLADCIAPSLSQLGHTPPWDGVCCSVRPK